MDSSIRFINVPKGQELVWVLQAAAIQQKIYEKTKYSPWQYSNGKRGILEEGIRNALVLEEIKGSSFGIQSENAFSIEETVEMLTNLIYKKIYGFTEYELRFIKPHKEIHNGNIRFPIFLVSSPMHSFIIDQAGCLYDNLLQFFMKHKFTLMIFCYSKILKVHDFQALLNEVKRGFPEETNASGTCDEGNGVGEVCREICKNLGLTSEFAFSDVYSIGKNNDNFCHFPVFRVVSKFSVFYVDHQGRVYKNWEDFVEHNSYPKCLMCYPRGGIYQANLQGKVLIDIAYSPAGGINFLSLVDNAGLIIGVGSLFIGSGTFGSVAIAFAAACGIAAGGYRLHDRWRHEQSLTSLEAAGSWLQVIGGVAGLGTASVKLARELVSGMQLTNAMDDVALLSRVVASNVNSAQQICNVAMKLRSAKQSLKGIKITSEDVNAVYSYILIKAINLKNVVIELCFKVKKYLLELWHKHFSHHEYPVIAESISSTISASEKLEHYMEACKQEDDAFEVIEFIMEVKADKLKKLKKKYFIEKELEQKSLGSNFNESIFDEKWGMKTGFDRETAFLAIVDSQVSIEDFHQSYEKYHEEVSVLNESDSLKFRSNIAAINNYLRCYFINDYITPKEYFPLIRRVGRDPQLIVKIEKCDFGRFTTLYDKTVPLTVIIMDAVERTWFISTDFDDFRCENQ